MDNFYTLRGAFAPVGPKKQGCFIAIVVLLAALVVVVPVLCGDFYDTEYVEVTVKKTELVDGQYLVFADSETFQNEDSLWFWKFDSSNLYGSLEEGKRYRFRVYGWRVPFLSWYRNIAESTPIE